jgi:hypothetical protein
VAARARGASPASMLSTCGTELAKPAERAVRERGVRVVYARAVVKGSAREVPALGVLRQPLEGRRVGSLSVPLATAEEQEGRQAFALPKGL